MLQIDSSTDETILRSLNNLIAQVGDIRRQAETVPFVSTGILSTQVQLYLRSSDDATWLKLRSLIDPLADDKSVPGLRSDRVELDTLLRNQTLTPDQRTALGELWAYGQRLLILSGYFVYKFSKTYLKLIYANYFWVLRRNRYV